MAPKKITHSDLLTAFEHKNFAPLYFFFGTEGFLISELETSLIANALEPHEKDFNLDIVYGAESNIDQVIGLCSSYPVMAQKRVVLIRDFEKIKENKKFAAYTERPNPTAIVVASCRNKPNLSAHPYRALNKNAVAVEFKPLRDREMTGWINNRVRKHDYEADGRAVQMLVEFVGTDLRTAAGEVDKLFSYLGDRRRIEVDDVLLASGQTREYNVFELQKAIGEGNYPKALSITERLLQQANNPSSEAVRIIAILNAFVIKLWRLTVCQQKQMNDSQIAQHIGVRPYFIKDYVRSLRFFTPHRIQNGFKLLLAADFEVKGGSSRDARLIMTLLLRGLMPSGASAAA